MVSLHALLAALVVAACACSCSDDADAAWRKPRRFPPPPTADQLPAAPVKLNVHAWTIPAHGHYMTLRDIALALVARGHEVTFVMCDRSRSFLEQDSVRGVSGAGARNYSHLLHFLSAGPCTAYDEHDAVMRKLIAHEDIHTVQRMLRGVADLNKDMFRSAASSYASLATAEASGLGSLPDVLLFDADTFAAMDISIQYRIPRVARVGTGLRDAYSTPFTVPAYQSALSARMGLLSRVQNALLLLLSRFVLTPMILPGLQAPERAGLKPVPREHARFPPPVPKYMFTPGAAAGVNAYTDVDDFSTLAALDAFRHTLPWDGVPTLYNTHWGLEHPRPLQPYEHVIGHTTDFEYEATRSLPPCVAAWMRAAPHIPIVYVSLGTLAVAPAWLLHNMVAAFKSSQDARFLWAVPSSQQAFLPADALLHTQAWEHACDEGGGAPSAGDLLLAEWLPQTAVLMHNATRVFLTHAGMNSVGEGVFAHTPFVCVPLFSDQHDNCAHIADFHLGVALTTKDLNSTAFHHAVRAVLNDESYQRAHERAWLRNVASGGIPAAVAIVESAAYAGYGGHAHTIPAAHYMSPIAAAGLDVAAVLLAGLLVLALSCYACTRGCVAVLCRRSAAAVGDGGKKVKRQ